jgi:hypothetical protein
LNILAHNLKLCQDLFSGHKKRGHLNKYHVPEYDDASKLQPPGQQNGILPA